MEILLVILLIFVLFGGTWGYRSGYVVAGPGIGLILVIVILVLLLR